MHVALCEFLLVGRDLVQLAAHVRVCLSSADLATEDVAALGGGTGLAVASHGVGSTRHVVTRS